MTVTCNRCGTVAFEVSREYAIKEVDRFNEYFKSLSPQEQQDYYGGNGASLKMYEYCGCGNRDHECEKQQASKLFLFSV